MKCLQGSGCWAKSGPWCRSPAGGSGGRGQAARSARSPWVWEPGSLAACPGARPPAGCWDSLWARVSLSRKVEDPPALVLPERLSSVPRDQGHRNLELGGFLGNVPSTCLVSQTWTARLRGKRGAARSPGESRGGGLEVAPESWARCGSHVTYKRLSQSGNHKCHPGGPGAGDPDAHTGKLLHASGFQSWVLGAARFNLSQAR